MKNIKLINVPLSSGCDRIGANTAPKSFMAGGIVEWLTKFGHRVDVTSIDEFAVIDENNKNKFANNVNVKYLSEVCKANSKLRDVVKGAFNEGFFPLMVGGDHSLGLGSMAGVAATHNNVGVIWFDAHGDINTEATSPSGNAHGMPCAAAIGICKSALNDIAEVKLNPHNFFWVGARDLDEGEKEYMTKNNLNVYSSDLIREKGMNYVVEDIIKKIKSQGIENVHCSIDIDGMDPSIVKATGTPVPNGMTNEDYEIFVTALLNKINLVSCDFVEYNPALEDDTKFTFEWCKKALILLAQNI